LAMAFSPYWTGRNVLRVGLQHAAADLVEFDALEQRLEIAFAEAFVALALDDLEEDRANHVLGEYLQQQALIPGRSAVDQDLQLLQPRQVLVMAGHALGHLVVIGVQRRLEGHVAAAQGADRAVDVVRAQRHMLDALAAVGLQVFGDLRLVVGAFVDRDADLAARTGHRLGFQPGQLALDVKILDLAEIEEPLVELGPFRHAATMHVVCQVVDIGQADAFRIALGALDRHEVDIIDGAARSVAVDQIDQAVADALDGGDGEFHRPDMGFDAPGAELAGALVGLGGIPDAEGHGTDRRTMDAGEALGKAFRLGIEDEVDVALA